MNGLALRLAALASALVLAASAGVGYALTRAASDDLQIALKDRGVAVARGLAQQAGPALARGEIAALGRILDAVWSDDDLARVEIVNPFGRVVVARTFDAAPRPGAVVVYPITGAADADGIRDALGLVRVTLSGDGVAAREAAYTQRAVWISGAIGAAGVTLAVGLGLALARPLSRLANAADEVARGDYRDVELPSRGPAELRRLAAAFRAAVAAVDERETALKALNTDLHNTQAARDAMTHMLVHDLKGPLGNVVTLMSILEGAALDPEDQELVQESKARCGRLLQLIEDLLDIARLEYGELPLARTDVPVEDLLLEAAANIRGLAADRGFVVEVAEVAGTVAVDRGLMERALINLAVNAIRHGASPIRLDARTEGGWVLSVSDGGAGVPPGAAAGIFEKFRSGTGDGPRTGAGLGLAFVKLATEAHGGRVSVDGATFALHLPEVSCAAS